MSATNGTRREHLPSPGIVKSDMDRVRRVAAQLDHEATVVIAYYEELYEASLSVSRQGEGGMNPPERRFIVSDPTGDVATSAMHARMRRHVRNVASKLRRIMPILEETENLMVSAFSELDPEFRAKWIRLLRELEEA